MTFIRIISILTAIFFCFSTGAQSPEPVEFSSQLYTKKDGLWSNYVERVVESESGELYFLNAKGVLKFNGATMEPVINRGKLDYDSRITMGLIKNKIVLAVSNKIFVYSTKGKLISSKTLKAQNCLPAFEIGVEGNSTVNTSGMWVLGKEDNSSFAIDNYGNVFYRDGDDVKYVNIENLSKEFSVTKQAGKPKISCSKVNYVAGWIKYQISGFIKDNKGNVWIELANDKGLLTVTPKGKKIVPVQDKLITNVVIDKNNLLWIQNNLRTDELNVYTEGGKKLHSFSFAKFDDDLVGPMCVDKHGTVYANGVKGIWYINSDYKPVKIAYSTDISGRSGDYLCFATAAGDPYFSVRGLVYHIKKDKTVKLIYKSVNTFCTLPFQTTDSFGCLWFSDCSEGLVKIFPSPTGSSPAPEVADSRLLFWAGQANYVMSKSDFGVKTISHIGKWTIAHHDTLEREVDKTSNLVFLGDTAYYLFMQKKELYLAKQCGAFFQKTKLKHAINWRERLPFGYRGQYRKDGFNDLVVYENELYLLHPVFKGNRITFNWYRLKQGLTKPFATYTYATNKVKELEPGISVTIDEIQTNTNGNVFYRIGFFEASHVMKSIGDAYVCATFNTNAISFETNDFNLKNAQLLVTYKKNEYVFSNDSLRTSDNKVFALANWLGEKQTDAKVYYAVNNSAKGVLINSRQQFYLFNQAGLTKLNHPVFSYLNSVVCINNNWFVFRNENDLYLATIQDNKLVCTKILAHLENIDKYTLFYESKQAATLHVLIEESISHKTYLKAVNLINQSYVEAPLLQVKSFLANEMELAHSKQYELSYHQNQLQVQLAGVQTAFGEEMEYTYIVEGLMNHWSIPQADPSITLTGLSPGNYTLRVKAVLKNHNLESKTLVLEIRISWPWWQSTVAYVCYAFVLVIVVVGFMRYRTRALEKRQALLEETVKQRTSEVVTQKNIIEQKNKEILDSIHYAKKIQAAILPPASFFNACFPNNFIFYLPKDIVAGDFYWIHKTDDAILFAVADCTGHGVPGAMVSVVCNNALNRSVREFGLIDPGQILNRTREIVIHEFDREVMVDGVDVNTVKRNTRENGSPEIQIQDGMDIALCTIKGNTLRFSGANNPVLIFRNGECIELKGQKQPIGKYQLYENFVTQEVELIKGDVIYLFSDGYADQFGGDKGKKFKYSNLQKLLTENATMDMNKQFEKLRLIFDSWKGELEQLDDVCVVGIKF